MLNLFKDNSTQPTRALQIWQILIGKAVNRQTMTYESLADLIGFKGAGTLGEYLGHILYFCKQNNLPLLTVLVVNKETGLPGKGLEDALPPTVDFHAERERVFNHKWFDLYPPSPEELKQAYKSLHVPKITAQLEI